jgi:hypothetical protein
MRSLGLTMHMVLGLEATIMNETLVPARLVGTPVIMAAKEDFSSSWQIQVALFKRGFYFWRVAALAIPRNIPPNTSSWSG